jgi:hypothetical protein
LRGSDKTGPESPPAEKKSEKLLRLLIQSIRKRAILGRVTASYSFKAELWLYPGEAGWHFLTLPADVADDIHEQSAGGSMAFGSVRVTAEIAGHSWQTSLFADQKAGSYLLPVKKAIRDKVRIGEGDEVAVHLSIQGT